MATKKPEFFETGVVATDLIFGGYLPKGKVIELNGESGCVDADTEFFNGTQWKKISEYSEGDEVLQFDLATNIASLATPEEYIVLDCNKMTEFKTKYGVNQCLTDNHLVPYITSRGHWKTSVFEDVKAKHLKNALGFRGRFKTTFDYEGTGVSYSDTELRLLVAIIADGHFSSEAGLRCEFNLKKTRKIERLVGFLKELDYAFDTRKNSEGYTRVTFYAPERLKEYPKAWYACTREQFAVIVEECQLWDGSDKRFYTTNRPCADFIQFACACIGVRASIYTLDRRGRTRESSEKDYTYKSVEYTVLMSGNPLVSIMNPSGGAPVEMTDFTPKDGKCYCFRVPTGYLVLRRGDRIFITGNCGKTTLSLFITSKVVKQGGKALYIDIEKGVTKDLAAKMGLDKFWDKSFVVRQDVSLFSEVQTVIDEALGKNTKDRTKLPVPHEDTPDIIILDSLAMLMPDSSKEKNIEDNVSNNMLMARYTTQFFRDIVGDLAATGTTLIFINHIQTRFKKIGFSQQISVQDSAGCGMVKYGTDIRLMIDKAKTIKKERQTILGKQEAKIGTQAEIWSKKSRLSDNEIRVPIMIIDGMGVFNGYTLRPICENLGWVTTSGGGYHKIHPPIAKEVTSVRGENALIAWLQKNAPKIVETLKKDNLYQLTYDKDSITCMSDLIEKESKGADKA